MLDLSDRDAVKQLPVFALSLSTISPAALPESADNCETTPWFCKRDFSGRWRKVMRLGAQQRTAQ